MSRSHLQKRHRELIRQLQPTMDELGVTFIGFSVRGNGHLSLQLDLGHGTGNLIVSNSPSCPHADENARRNLRRMVREKSGPLEGA